MPAPDELYPPAQYGIGWMLLAVGVLALLALAGWLVMMLTRSRMTLPTAAESPHPVPSPMAVSDALRREYLVDVQRIENDYRAGTLTPRAAHLELSRTVRAFVSDYSGIEAPVLALDDLEKMGVHPALIDALRRHYYPSIFHRGPGIDPIAGAEAARKVVNTWY